jgi:hypothetical protein
LTTGGLSLFKPANASVAAETLRFSMTKRQPSAKDQERRLGDSGYELASKDMINVLQKFHVARKPFAVHQRRLLHALPRGAA